MTLQAPTRRGASRATLLLIAASLACRPEGGSSPPDAADAGRTKDAGSTNAPCVAYQPSDTAWSSLPTSRPANMGPPVASSDGRFIYAVGAWSDGGVIRRQILRSSDLGSSWCVLPTAEPIAEVIPAPASPDVLYAITHASNPPDAVLLRTTDAGTTWIAQGKPPAGTAFADAGLVVATSDPTIVWLTRTIGDVRHLSQDGGRTWTARKLPLALTLTSDTAFTWIETIVVDASSPNRVLASGSGLQKATSGSFDPLPRRVFATEDWGSSWTELHLPVGPAAALALNDVLSDGASGIYLADEVFALWRSTDWGKTWKRGAALPSVVAHMAMLGVHQTGELYAWPWRTVDGGASWRQVTAPDEPAFEPVLVSLNGSEIVGLTGVGLTSTSDGGATWRRSPLGPHAGWRPTFATQSPVEPRALWHVGFFESPRGVWYPTLRSPDGGLTWTRIGNFGGLLAWDGATADVVFSLPGGEMERTEDGGLTWQTVARPLASARILSAATCAAPLSCLYGLYLNEGGGPGPIFTARSDDHGRTWSEPRPIPTSLGFIGFPGPLVISPDDARRLFVPCGGRLCESADAGLTWAISGLPGPALVFLPGGVILEGSRGVQRSPDGGATFAPVLSTPGKLVPSHARPGTVFLIPDDPVSAATPLHRSDDAGQSWRSAVPSVAMASGFVVDAVMDAPGGGFIALVDEFGLVRFD